MIDITINPPRNGEVAAQLTEGAQLSASSTISDSGTPPPSQEGTSPFRGGFKK